MRILGLNAGFDAFDHAVDSGALAVIEDGIIRLAIAEERVARRKHAGGYAAALKELERREGLRPADFDLICVSFYGHSILPEPGIVERLAAELRVPVKKLYIVASHHLSHAALAFHLSPFEKSLVVVCDNEGTVLDATPRRDVHGQVRAERNSYFWAHRNSIALLERDFADPRDVGFGKAYNRFTRYIGLGSYHNAGKTMGLAPYGSLDERWSEVQFWYENDRGETRSHLPLAPDPAALRAFLEASSHAPVPPPGDAFAWREKPYQDLAALVQTQLNRWAGRRIASLAQRMGTCDVCMSGGVALNSVLNAHLEREYGLRVFAPPFPGDEGQALGNAILGYLRLTGANDNTARESIRFDGYTYLGFSYSDADVRHASERAKDWRPLQGDAVRAAAQLLRDGGVVALFHGRSEYGARALGARSLLADPRQARFKTDLNVLKGREAFRPFAPALLRSRAAEYIDGAGSLLHDHMLGVAKVKRERAAEIPAVVHVDDTTRPQVVAESHAPMLHRLISAFNTLTGIPVLLNTSFNYAGEPIVESPSDAFASATKIGVSALLLEGTLHMRDGEELPERLSC
jgi:carbamoyltransferase